MRQTRYVEMLLAIGYLKTKVVQVLLLKTIFIVRASKGSGALVGRVT